MSPSSIKVFEQMSIGNCNYGSVILACIHVANSSMNCIVCENGTYGENCTKGCGKCGDSSTCNAENGECRSCLQGFRTPFCQEGKLERMWLKDNANLQIHFLSI